MPGLVPGIHADPPGRTSYISRDGAAWMAGTSQAMTGARLSPCSLHARSFS